MMLSLPGKYLSTHEHAVQKRLGSVSLKQAKTLGISIYGSQETMESVGVWKKARKLLLNKLLLAGWPSGSTLDFQPRDLFTLRYFR